MSYKITASSNTNDLVQNHCGSNKNERSGGKVKCNFQNLSLAGQKTEGNTKSKTRWWGWEEESHKENDIC